MSRINAQAKMEFYPTPEIEISKALSKIDYKVPVRILDPCSGDGRTLKIFKETLNAETYGVELDASRRKQSSEFGNVLEADALTEVRISAGSFNVIFNNPPYDEGNAYGSRRMETAFIERYEPTLCKGGIMFLVVPESILCNFKKDNEDTKKTILTKFAVLDAYKLEADQTYKQWMLILRKLNQHHPLAVIKNDGLEIIGEDGYPVYYGNEKYSDLIEISKRLNPNVDHGDFSLAVEPYSMNSFKSFRITEEQYKTASAFNNKTITRILDKLKPQERVNTLLPLRKSHVALLLTTGALNGLIKGTPLVINGKIERTVLEYEDMETKKDKNGVEREISVSKSVNKFIAKVSVMDISGQEPKIIELN